jgi:hypothetical protein
LKLQHKGFVLLESLTAFTISLMIILTLTYCVNEQFKLLNRWEEQVNADKIVLLNLKNNNIPNPLIIEGQKYFFSRENNLFKVSVNNHVYQIEK